MRHFKESASLHEVLARAQRNELAGVTVYSFECDLQQATELLEMARDRCPPAVKDSERAIFAATRVETQVFGSPGAAIATHFER